VFTARYALSLYIKQVQFVFKGLISGRAVDVLRVENVVQSPLV
jgi:hypothetical protein